MTDTRSDGARIQGVIFDCDGVLINSRDANISYYNALLAEVGRPPMTLVQENYVHMASEKQAVAHILTPEEFARYDELTAKVPYREVVLPLLQLEEGAWDVLHWLRDQGTRMAVHTNRGKGMWNVLDKFSMRGLFDPVMTVDIVAPKPSPEGVTRILKAWNMSPSDIVFVGDSRTDVEAAQGAGVPLIAFKNETLSGAAAHVRSFDELRVMLRPRLCSLAVNG